MAKTAQSRSFPLFTHRDATRKSLADNTRISAALPSNARLLASSSEWYRNVTALPVHANNALWSGRVAASYANRLWPLGFYRYEGSDAGTPYIAVDAATEPLVRITPNNFRGDIAWAPIPVVDHRVIQEWEAGDVGARDRHVLCVALRNGVPETIYEMWHAWPDGRGGWRCATYATFQCAQGDLQRPWQWTSADVAGCSYLTGLIRADELRSGFINHAIRWTPQQQERLSYLPATHHVFGTTGANAIPVGTRMRLRANFDRVTAPSGQPWHPYARTILDACATYGLIAADGGLSIMASADAQLLDPDSSLFVVPLWQVTMAAFDFVETGYAPVDIWTSPPTGTRPVLTVSQTAQEVTSGNPVTINYSATGHNRLSAAPFDGVKLTNTGVAVVNPTRTSWYATQAYNQFGQRITHSRVIVTADAAVRATPHIYLSPTGSVNANGSAARPYSIADYLAQIAGGDISDAPRWAGAVVQFAAGTYDLSALALQGPLVLPLQGGSATNPTVWQAASAGTVTLALGTSTGAIGGFPTNGHIELVNLTITGGRGLSALRFYGEHTNEVDRASGVRIDNCTLTGLQNADASVCVGIYLQNMSKTYVRGCTVTGVTATGGATASAIGIANCDDTRVRAITNTGIARDRDFGGNTGSVFD
jgi:hypothetical protein